VEPSGFVVGGDAFVLFVHDAAALLSSPGDFIAGLLEVFHFDGVLVVHGSEDGGLVDDGFEVGAGKAGGPAGKEGELDLRGEFLLSGVDFEDGLSSLHVGEVDADLPVEAARSTQGGVEDVGAVGGGQEDDVVVGIEAVHFDEDGVEGLFALVVSAAPSVSASSADSIDLVEKDDAGGVFLGLSEEVPDAAGADADEHLDEVGAGDVVEGDIGLSGDGFGKQGFSAAGRSDEENAFRDSSAEALEAFGALEERDDRRHRR